MRVYAGEVEERKTAATEMPTTTATSCSSKVEEAGRLPSIETEPKTLTLDQIKYARAAALYVVSTKTEEEAIRIFTAGLRPVQVKASNARSNSNKSSSMDCSSDDDVDLGGVLDGDGSNTCGRDTKGGGGAGRRRLGGRRQRHSIDNIRDIATAPF